jgi:tetratricopeptide (TPR) repeat protein
MKARKYILALAGLAAGACLCSQARPADRDSYREGKRLMAAGMFDEARVCFERADASGEDQSCCGYATLCALKSGAADREDAYGAYISKNPSSALGSKVRFEHARQLFDAGRFEEAEREFALVRPSALDASSKAELAFKSGWCRYAGKDYGGAKSIFSDVQKMPFSDYTAPSRYLLGYIAYTEKNFDEAVKWFTLSAKDGRFTQLSRFYLTDCRFMKHDYDYVIEEGTKLFGEMQAGRKAHLARIISESYLVRGDAVKAREYYLQGPSVEHSRSDSFFSGSVFYAVKDYEAAIGSFLKMQDRSDSLGQVANYQLGWSYIQTKNKVAALDAFKAASEADYNWQIREDAAFNYAKLAFDLNHDSSAFARYLKEYSTLSKGDRIYGYMALAALYDRDYAAAVEAYDNVETLDRTQKMNYAKANYLRASQLTAGGSWRDAVPYLKAAAFYLPKQNQFNQLARYWLGESWYHSGNYEEALQVYTDLYNVSALDRRPEGKALSYNMAYCQFGMENYGEAARWFDYYIATGDPTFRQDALVKRADCDFARKRYKAAAASYKKAVDEDPSAENIYPRYRQALSLGLTGDRQGKVSVLAPVSKAPKDAPMYCEAMYELGRAYMDVENYDKALGAFSTLRRNAADSSYAARSLIGLGMTNRNMTRYDKALANYKRVVAMMPGSEYAEDALLAIESIYQARREPEKYLEYVEANSLASGKSEADRELMYFNTGQQIFLAENYPQAIISLQKFLDKYPKSSRRFEAWFYMAESYRLSGDKEKACDWYSKVLDADADGPFKEQATLGLATQSYALERWGKAYTAYSTLREIAILEGNKELAEIGMMRSAFRARDYFGAIEATEFVEKQVPADKDLARECRYVKAKSLLSSSRRAEAMSLLPALAAEPSTPEGAEARLLLIQDSFDQGRFAEVEEMVYDFASVAGSQSYWLARAFLVLGDSFFERGNEAQARATWESVRDGYVSESGSDDVPELAKLKLEKLNHE